jgi:release factor glutamine methyltransferase
VLAEDSIPGQLGAALKHLRGAFSKAGVETPELDARLLLEWAAGADRLAVLTAPERIIGASEASRLHEAMTRRLGGEPVHRIIGRRGFHGLEFELSPDTLEPRPDTECLVELVLKHLKGREDEALSLLDLGTGTGIIAVSLLANLPNARATATDISAGALETCGRNAETNDVFSRLTLVQCDWFEAVTGRFDIIVSNPPYVPTEVINSLSREVREFDPARALDGGADGLDAYRALAEGAEGHLAEKGLFALEIGYDQRSSVSGIFEKSGFVLVEAAKDLGGNDRALLFTRMG